MTSPPPMRGQVMPVNAFRGRADGARRNLAVVVALSLVAVFQLMAFYPGYVTHDSAYQWWQARTGDITTLWPPGMVFLLQAFGKLGNGPTTLFVVNGLIYWAAAAYIATRQAGWIASWSCAALLALAPTVMICLPHVWSDVTLAVWLFAASALLHFLLSTRLSPWTSRSVLTLACALLVYAVLLRHNAWCALPPLCWLAALQWHRIEHNRLAPAISMRVVSMIAMALFATALTVYALVPRAVSKTHADTWAITLIWDLQALSVASGAMLMPSSISDNATLDDLRQSFDPVNAVTLYVKSTARWANATVGLTATQKSDLLSAWGRAVWHNPRAYVSHRLFVLAKMLGVKRNVQRDGGADEPGHVQFRDNPSLEFTHPALLRIARSWIDWLKPQWWTTPIVWMTIPFFYLIVRLRKAGVRTLRTAVQQPAIAIWASGFMYLIPMALLNPTADLRYVLWPVLASVVAALLPQDGQTIPASDSPARLQTA